MSAIRILIVDDMETNRVILEQIIADMGYKPVLAESGCLFYMNTDRTLFCRIFPCPEWTAMSFAG